MTKTVSTPTADPLEVFTYSMNFTCPSTVAGNCENVVLTDVLPTGLEFINAPSGLDYSYDETTGEFSANLDEVVNGSTRTVTIQVRFNEYVIEGTEVINIGDIDYTQNGTDYEESSNPVSTTVVNGTVLNYSNVGYGDKENTQVPEFNPEGGFDIFYGHSSNTDVSNFIVEDILPDHFVFEGIVLRKGECNVDVDFNVEYYVYDSLTMAYSWVSSTLNPYSVGETYHITDTELWETVGGIILGSGQRIQGSRLIYPTMPGDGCFHPDTPYERHRFQVYFDFDESISGIADPIAGDFIENCATIKSDDFPEVENCGNVSILENEYTMYSIKYDITNTSPYQPGEVIRYSIRASNTSYGAFPIVNPHFVDVIPPGLEYIGNVTIEHSSSIENTPGSTTFMPNVTSTFNYNGVEGQTKLDFQYGDEYGNGMIFPEDNGWNGISIYYDVRVMASAPDLSTLTNTLVVFTDSTSIGCTGVDVDDLNGDGDNTQLVCFNTVDVDILYPPGYSGLDSYKEVKGNLDTDFSRYPNSGHVSPLGNIEYNLCLSNPANLTDDIENIILIDVLPHIGDRGVVANDELRETAWNMKFTDTTLVDLQTYVATIPGAVLYFSTECEPCLNGDLGVQVPDLPTCSPPNWSSTAPANLSDVCSFKIDFGPTFQIAVGESLCINMNMVAPADIPTDETIAWNSFGFVGSKVGGGDLLASEPIKVGISALPPDCMISIDNMTTSACDDATNTYDLVVNLSYSGEPIGDIEITTSNGITHTFSPSGNSPETITIEDLESNGDTDITVTADFDNDATCTTTYSETIDAPANCTAADCTVTIDSAIPTACDPMTNTYNVSITVSYTDGPGGNITLTTSSGQTESFVSKGTGPETFMFTDIVSDGTSGISVTASFDSDGTCTATSLTTYDAPENCCPDAFQMCPGDSYTLTAEPGLTNYQWLQDNGTGLFVEIVGETNQTYTASTIGTYKWTATDATNCPSVACCPVEIIVGASCCEINTPVVTVECNNNGTPSDTTDDTFTYNISVTGTGTSTYAISGSDIQSSLAFDTNNGPFGPFNISAGELTLTITDETDSSCTQSIVVTPPAPCSSCPEPICLPTIVTTN